MSSHTGWKNNEQAFPLAWHERYPEDISSAQGTLHTGLHRGWHQAGMMKGVVSGVGSMCNAMSFPSDSTHLFMSVQAGMGNTCLAFRRGSL